MESGAELGQYRLEGKIGEGGMGVVWEATDTRLNRKVAVKFLPASLAGNPERLERFNREARVLASLNHAHIAGIFGLEEHAGAPFLVMELVPGGDLSKRIAQGPLPVDEALHAARQVADGLEAAHESGVVHRDLKPANIQLTLDGNIKVLDFGLAKALETEDGSSSASMSPTLTTPATMEGTILGTAAYMSPEQAKGKPVDRRADIWAFGVVLYEMLTGTRPFKGDGVSETLASVIMGTPSLEALPRQVPAAVRRLIGRCLEKDPHRRLRDIGEARFILDEVLAGHDELPADGSGQQAVPAGPGVPLWLAGVVAITLAVATGFGTLWLSPPANTPEAMTRRFRLPVEMPSRASGNGNPIALSPDGTRLAYFSDKRLWLHRLDRLEPEAVETRDEVQFVFWSPDSQWLGFAAGDGLWKVGAEGGEVLTILDQAGLFSGGSGGSWTDDDRILLSRGDGPLYEVSARGGDLQVILEPDLEREDDLHQPLALPGNRGIVFVSHTVAGRPDRLELLAGGQRRTLLDLNGQDIWDPAFAASGHILYRRQPVNPGIWALPFSLDTLEVSGEPFLVVPSGDLASVSADGTLVHVTGSNSRTSQMAWLNREGEVLELIGQAETQWPFPRLSPDQRFVAVTAADNELFSLWIHDLERGTRTLASSSIGATSMVDWSPDGRDLLLGGAGFSINRQTIGHLGQHEELGIGYSTNYSPDGRFLITAQRQTGEDWDLVYKEVGSGDEWVRVVDAPLGQLSPRVSPDGKYLVYMSNENGKDEVYLREFPSGAGLWQVSVDGGSWPQWSAAGDRIYYVREDTIFEVDVELGASVRLSRARPVVTRPALTWSIIFGWPAGFDVSTDGKRFLVCLPVGEEDRGGGIVLVENWLTEAAKS